jgi:hypothetical protein
LQELPFFHATCISSEARLQDCRTHIEQCDPIDSAGIICEANCEDEETRKLLEDNENGAICKLHAAPSSQDSHAVPILAGVLAVVMLFMALLVVLLIVLLLKLRAKSSGQVLQKYHSTNPLPFCSNSTSKTDLAPGVFEPQNMLQQSTRSSATGMLESQNVREQLQQSSRPSKQNHLAELKQPEASLPHLYESLRGQKLWLNSPRGSALDILEEEERGAAAAYSNDAGPNSIGNNHPYAVLEPEEDFRCKFAGPETADSLPSLLAPSTPDHDGSADESAISSAAAVLNFETNALPLPPKLESLSPPPTGPRFEGMGKSRKESFPDNVTNFSAQTYDSLQPKRGSLKLKSAAASDVTPEESRVTLSLKPTIKKSEGASKRNFD